MSNYCEHCQGQRFDRAQVLRALRRVREQLREGDRESTADEAVALALNAVKALEIPHLDDEADQEGQLVH